MEIDGAVAWPFAVGGAISERWEFLTDVLDPPYGPPQTRKLRQQPRVYLNFDGLETRDARRYMEQQLSANRAGLWHVPLAIDATTLAFDAAPGAMSLAVAPAHRRFTNGGNAILTGATAREHEVVQIAVVGTGDITLASPLVGAWKAGATLTPTIGARLAQAPNLARFTGDTAPYSVSFRVDEPIDWSGDPAWSTYRGFPVMEVDPDWSSDPDVVHERRIEAADTGVGRVRLYDLAGMVRPETRYDTTTTSREALERLRTVLWALAGRWQPVWVPSLGMDIVPTAVAGNLVDVRWFGFAQWPVQSNRRDLRIEMTDGTVLYRRITAATELDPDTERLLLDSALPIGVDADSIALISFMALSVQDADAISLRLWNDYAVQATLSFQGITHDF